MNITVLQENLHKAVTDAVRCIASKPQLSILSGILLQAADGKIQIKATDLRVGFQTTIGGKIEEAGECVIPAKVFSELIASLQPGTMTIRCKEEVISIEQGRTKAKIPGFPATDFPPFPSVSSAPLRLPAQEFFAQIEQAAYAASLDETRPVLASVLLKFSDKTSECVATDGYRLVASSALVEQELPVWSVLLNAKMLSEIIRILARFKPKTVDLAVSSELQQVQFSIGDTVILARLIEGEFPPYERIIPSSFALRTLLDREEMISALCTALVVAKESSSIVTLHIEAGKVKVTATSTSLGENEVELDSSYSGELIKTISFNAKFMTDALTHIQTQRVELCVNDELKPVVLFPENDENYTTVIMPFKR